MSHNKWLKLKTEIKDILKKDNFKTCRKLPEAITKQ